MCQPEASPLSHGQRQAELSEDRWDPFPGQANKFSAPGQRGKPKRLYCPIPLFCALGRHGAQVREGGISCWGNSAVQVRPLAGSWACSVGWGSRWLCTRWSAVMGRSWLCRQGSSYSCSVSAGRRRNQRKERRHKERASRGQGVLEGSH